LRLKLLFLHLKFIIDNLKEIPYIIMVICSFTLAYCSREISGKVIPACGRVQKKLHS
jgi:hypothetical protein